MEKYQETETDDSRQLSFTREVFSGLRIRPSANVEICAAGRKPITVHRLTLATDDLRLIHSSVRGASIRRGTLPAPRSFGLTKTGRVPNNWCGHAEDGRSICCFAGEFEAFSAGDFEGATMTFSPKLMRAICGDTLAMGESAKPSLHLPTAEVRMMAHRTLAGLESLCGSGSDADLEAISRETRRVCDLLVTSVHVQKSDSQRPTRGRQRHFEVAVAFIESTLAEPMTLNRLSLKCGVSARTLEYAFKECSGMSPKAYVKSRKLQRVHAELVSRDGTESIADVANRWGFWHMGQFARDFRRQYGVLPREVRRG